MPSIGFSTSWSPFGGGSSSSSVPPAAPAPADCNKQFIPGSAEWGKCMGYGMLNTPAPATAPPPAYQIAKATPQAAPSSFSAVKLVAPASASYQAVPIKQGAAAPITASASPSGLSTTTIAIGLLVVGAVGYAIYKSSKHSKR